MTAKKSFDIPKLLGQINALHEQGKMEEVRDLTLQAWPGMEADIRLVAQELIFEARKHGDAPLFFKDVKFTEDKISIEMPDWFQCALKEFHERYEEQEAELRFRKAVATLQERFFDAFGGAPSAAAETLEQVIEESFAATPPRWGRA